MAAGMDMVKPQPEQVAIKTFETLKNGDKDVLPDDFSLHMYASFLEHPHHLEQAFAQMV